MLESGREIRERREREEREEESCCGSVAGEFPL